MKFILALTFFSLVLASDNNCTKMQKRLTRQMTKLNDLMSNFTCRASGKVDLKDLNLSTEMLSSKLSSIGTTIGMVNENVSATTSSPQLRYCKPGETRPFIPLPDAENVILCVVKPESFVKDGFTFDDLDERLCTHVVLAYAVKILENKDYEMRLLGDIAPIEKIIKYCKVFDMKVLIEIGSWDGQSFAPKQFSRMAKNKTARELFVNNTLGLMQRYEIDGIFLRWLYPVCWFVVCTNGPGVDKPNFSLLLKYMNKIIRSESKLVIVDAPSNTFVINTVFEFNEVMGNVDYLAVYTCEYSGDWSTGTALTAPYKSFMRTLQFYSKIVSPNKLLATISSEIVPVKLAKIGNTRIGSYILGRSNYSMDSYVKVCYNVRNNGATAVKGSDDDYYAYAYKDQTWASYDSVDLIRQKMSFLSTLDHFGGVVFRYLSDDDFNGTVCMSGRYPMLRTINEEIRGNKTLVNSYP
ncbi:probable chitinase 10 [Neocloeon triangulifer]|uniref:probable chitinase 10 n=1 Tax=Neocloeon triangulifer TaxID=2078957 RepID=UPI00286FAAEA|nr:probable chitinase 10 [Neocloeon triangulifer]